MILYLETSDLVKLYAEEPDSKEISGRVNAADIVATSILSYAEAMAALSRKYREKGIHEKDYERVKKELDMDWEHYFVLNLTNNLVKSAGDLSEKYALRGFDALHLASAVEIKRLTSLPVTFSSSHARLRSAAQEEGLVMA
ncbi:MAG: type II toxin-antitoxin system VapC family toxin [Candidatus Aminicenantes bacterium]|nr:type II toxin-antitoxin system VapC family toxin [Candidatus Aminicenantes bacterium]